MLHARRLLVGIICFMLAYILVLLSYLYSRIYIGKSIAGIISFPFEKFWIASALLGIIIFMILKKWVTSFSTKNISTSTVLLAFLIGVWVFVETCGYSLISIADFYWNHLEQMESFYNHIGLLNEHTPEDLSINIIFLLFDFTPSNILNALIAYATYYVCMINMWIKQRHKSN